MNRPLRVLFVCTANISRSPYAERRARDLFADEPIEFTSAGIPGLAGESIDPAMAVELAARGIDASDHRSRELTLEIAREADLIVCATKRHRAVMIDEWPSIAARTLTFGQARHAVDASAGDAEGFSLSRTLRRPPRASSSDDVADPYGLGPEVASRCAVEIDDHLRVIVPALLADQNRADQNRADR